MSVVLLPSFRPPHRPSDLRRAHQKLSADRSLICRPVLPNPIIPFLRYLSPQIETLLLTFIGTLASILLSCAISNALSTSFAQLPLAIGSLGATAVLLFAAPEGPLSQPRHLIGGHVISAIVGVCVSTLEPKLERSLADPWPSRSPTYSPSPLGSTPSRTPTVQISSTSYQWQQRSPSPSRSY